MIIIAVTALLAVLLWTALTIRLARRYPERKRAIVLSSIILPVVLCVAYASLFTQVSLYAHVSIPKGTQRPVVDAKLEKLLSHANLQRLLDKADATAVFSTDQLKEMTSTVIDDPVPDIEGSVTIMVMPPVLLKSRAETLKRFVSLLEKDAAVKMKERIM